MSVEYAVLHLTPHGTSMVCEWHSTPQETIAAASRLNATAEPGHAYRAVSTERYGYFSSLTNESLYIT